MEFQFVPPKGNLLLDVCVAQTEELILLFTCDLFD